MSTTWAERVADETGTDEYGERVVVDAALFRITAFPGGLRLHGDLDACTVDLAGAALAEAMREDTREIYLDLAAIDFCGTEGLRLFVTAAQRLGRQGRELVLCSISPHLVRVLRLLNWDAVPGLFLVPRTAAHRASSHLG